MKFKAAIFDMDGLLLDTERVCKTIFKQACSALNLPFLDAVYLTLIGCNSKRCEEILTAAYGSDYPALHNEWKRRYEAVVMHKAIPVKEGVVALLEWLKSQSIPMAVATSTERSVAKTKLKLAGLDKYFQNLTTGCEVTNSKPDPEIYILAAKRLGVEPQYCLSFEDSNNGIKAAVAAGTIAYQIPDMIQPTNEVIALGHTIKASLTDVLTELESAE